FTQEYVRRPVGVLSHQVVGQGPEGNDAAVGADRERVDAGTYGGSGIVMVPLGAGAIDVDAFGYPGLPIMNEDVDGIVSVVRDQVRGAGLEGHDAAVGTDCRNEATKIRLCAKAVDTDSFGRAGLPVAHEDVPRIIRVARYQVAGVGVE